MIHLQYELKEKTKHAALQLLKDEDLSVISLTDNSQKIYWEDDEKNEFSFNGEMYDLVKTETVNGQALLFCFNDKNEQQLIDLCNSITKNNSDTGKKAKNNSFPFITLFISETAFQSYFPSKTQKQFGYFTSHLTKGVTNNTAPPPRA